MQTMSFSVLQSATYTTVPMKSTILYKKLNVNQSNIYSSEQAYFTLGLYCDSHFSNLYKNSIRLTCSHFSSQTLSK